MAQSMSRPRKDVLIEDFSKASFFHAPSKRYYEMRWKYGRLLFRRYQLDARGAQINVFERKVDWIIGSGHRARVYLYQAPDGELFQLPVAWYTQEHAWGMAPGYDGPDHDGVERPVRRECLFCHDAYVEMPAGSDAHWAPQIFPRDLPEGTGCQRCHGPGARHVLAALAGESDDAVRAAIVNPAKLPPARRDSVCFQCHLLPAVAMPGVRRFDRGDESFRAGELLSDYLLHVEPHEPGRQASDRFEINHHAYRLQQSLCYQKGGITCITCHDPHVSLSKDKRLANVRNVCLGCHEKAHFGDRRSAGDCVACHMPRRRTQDVVHVVMTDHRIERHPPPGDLLAPLAEREPVIDGVTLFDRGVLPDGPLADAYRAVAVLRAQPRSQPALDALSKALASIEHPPETALIDLAAGQLRHRRYAGAVKTIARMREDEPQRPGLTAIAEAGLGHTEQAAEDLHKAIEAQPRVPELHADLGILLHRLGKEDEALTELSRAVELRPDFVVALVARSRVLRALGRAKEAQQDMLRARAVHPAL